MNHNTTIIKSEEAHTPHRGVQVINIQALGFVVKTLRNLRAKDHRKGSKQ